MKPLSGKRILVTRPRAQAADLCNELSSLGAEPILFPTIEIGPVEDPAQLDNALRDLSQYHWVIFTSVNGVAAFWQRLTCANLQFPAAGHGSGVKVAAIGPATARALARQGVPAHYIPEEYVAERILDGLGDVNRLRILLPRADVAREALAVELANRGAVVHQITAYRTLPAEPDPNGLAELRRGVDAITFTSASTVRNFVKLAHPVDPGTWRGSDPLLTHPIVACIGPITARTARELGLAVDVVAGEYTTAGLVAALVTYFSERQHERN